jgi:hypothetical protein
VWYYWCLIILFSFLPFPRFHRVVTLLQICSTTKFVYIMLVFVHMFIFGAVFNTWEKTCTFCVSDPGKLHLTWCPPIAFIYHKAPCHYSL